MVMLWTLRLVFSFALCFDSPRIILGSLFLILMMMTGHEMKSDADRWKAENSCGLAGPEVSVYRCGISFILLISSSFQFTQFLKIMALSLGQNDPIPLLTHILWQLLGE